MIYNPTYPSLYQPQVFPGGYPAQINQQAQNIAPSIPNQQIQNSGFLTVQSEQEARNYPVGPGNSIMFRDENAPYIYNKSMGYSQLDRPTFDKYRLVKEESETEQGAESASTPQIDCSQFALKSDLDVALAQIEEIKTRLNNKPIQQKTNRNRQEGRRND